MVGAFINVSVSPVSGFSQPSRRMLTTDWLMERLPAEAGDRHDALPRTGEDVELAEGRDVVDASIGAGVGEHHETVAH